MGPLINIDFKAGKIIVWYSFLIMILAKSLEFI